MFWSAAAREITSSAAHPPPLIGVGGSKMVYPGTWIFALSRQSHGVGQRERECVCVCEKARAKCEQVREKERSCVYVHR